MDCITQKIIKLSNCTAWQANFYNFLLCYRNVYRTNIITFLRGFCRIEYHNKVIMQAVPIGFISATSQNSCPSQHHTVVLMKLCLRFIAARQVLDVPIHKLVFRTPRRSLSSRKIKGTPRVRYSFRPTGDGTVYGDEMMGTDMTWYGVAWCRVVIVIKYRVMRWGVMINNSIAWWIFPSTKLTLSHRQNLYLLLQNIWTEPQGQVSHTETVPKISRYHWLSHEKTVCWCMTENLWCELSWWGGKDAGRLHHQHEKALQAVGPVQSCLPSKSNGCGVMRWLRCAMWWDSLG